MTWLLDEDKLEAEAEPVSSGDDEEIEDEEIVDVLKTLHAEALERGHLRQAKILSVLLSDYPDGHASEEESNEEEESDEDEEEKDENEDEDEDEDKNEDEENQERCITLTQRQWEALADWSSSALALDGDIATLPNKPPRILSTFHEEIMYPWDETDPDSAEELCFTYSSSAWEGLAELFGRVGRGQHIAEAVKSELRKVIVQAASRVKQAI